LIKKEDHYELSAYNDKLTKPVIVEMSIVIRESFPALPKGFYDIFSDRIVANNFTDQRLRDAVTHVIDNCIYPTPTIAQFISFDKHIKLYTYNQVLKLNDELSGNAFKFYRPVRIGENKTPVYAHVNDIEKFNLNPWSNE
jgi:hypothetical protein